MADDSAWQIIGGVTQIIATLFAAYATWQARQMMRQADEQRRQSVAPAWQLPSRKASPEYDHQRRNHILVLDFRNVGLGSARNVRVMYEPRNGNNIHDAVGLGDPVRYDPVLVDEAHQVALYWDYDKPLYGVISIGATSRLGDEYIERFYISTYLDKENDHNGWCDITPVIEDM
jgi:hypothetical protein